MTPGSGQSATRFSHLVADRFWFLIVFKVIEQLNGVNEPMLL